MDEEVEQFQSITGASERVARGYLQLSGNDAMQAIQLFFDNPDLAASFNQPQNTAPPAPAQSSSRTNTYTGRQDESGVIHIDSDDEMQVDSDRDADFVIPDDDDEDDIAAVVRNAQEEEDAAMARRLQEEMYGQNPGGGALDEEGVRAPIAQRTEMLAAPDPSWSLEDDRESAILEQLRRRQMPRSRGPANPFSQSVWEDSGAPPVPTSTRPAGDDSQPITRAQRLADLFRPPYSLMNHMSWDEARDAGKDDKKWLLVNLQDMSDFNCQALNRDLWKDDKVISIVKEHFIFLQYEKNDPQADSYITFYFANQAHENIDNYPHVSVIDPRTGEQVKVWSGKPFPSAAEFHADLVEFLDRYSLAANSKNPVAKSKPKSKPVDYGRLTEEEMLEMALKNSLESNGSGSSSANVEDPDSLTKSNPDIGKGKAPEQAVDLTAEEAPTEQSAFASISSTNPHVEPDNSPPATTRIQFRHPSGRIIRRFNVSDPVRRFYEWLKAEPLEGREGVVFELKAMPAGRDLIEELDKTIEESGLKQGTVMIEFIED